MAEAGISVSGTWGIMQMDVGGEIKAKLSAHTPELAETEVTNIQGRTPVLTGALSSSISAIAYNDEASDDLVYLYADDEPQLDEWNRVYAPYQEGGDLGLSTYTNGGHEMFARVLTDDLADIQAWGDKYMKTAVTDIVGN